MGNCPQGCFGKNTYLFVTAIVLGTVVLFSHSYISAALAFAFFVYVWKREDLFTKKAYIEEKKAEGFRSPVVPAKNGATKHTELHPASSEGLPVLAFVQLDNIDDVLQGLDEGQRSQVTADVNQHLVSWVGRQDGFIKKYSEDMYMGVFSRASLDRIIADKFDILDDVRAIRAGNKIPVTLSIGIATDEANVAAISHRAQAGLDLALGRGGDQAALHIGGEVQFFGGKAKPVEKNTRVKARVVAHAIRELMMETDTVLVMGHEGEDFDSLGAALGVARMARLVGTDVKIVVGQPGLAIDKLRELLPEYEEYRNLFVNAADSVKFVSPRSLLVIVDTHRVELTAAPQLLKLVERKVLIDHHRRSEDIIADPLIVYLEPSASSTSELVTELVGYFDEKIELSRLEASALYAGILVDTKNFAVQTGIRTFDAASYLRRAGADPVLVKHLFSVDLDTLKARAKILTGAQLLPGGIIIAICDKEVKNAQIIASQAADTMLTIEGIRVSFVLFHAEDGIGICARSNGEVNVQVIMEQLGGGGGHQTVAGTQLKNSSISEARDRLTRLIADYLGESDET